MGFCAVLLDEVMCRELRSIHCADEVDFDGLQVGFCWLVFHVVEDLVFVDHAGVGDHIVDFA